MTLSVESFQASPPRSRTGFRPITPTMARGVLVAASVAGLVAGWIGTGGVGAEQAGPDLTRLLRFMALLKGSMAIAAASVVMWRFGVGIRLPGLLAYATACAAMAAGPGLIWGMVHVGTGALLLHGGLAATVVLLWRDPAMDGRLKTLVAARRRRATP